MNEKELQTKELIHEIKMLKEENQALLVIRENSSKKIEELKHIIRELSKQL